MQDPIPHIQQTIANLERQHLEGVRPPIMPLWGQIQGGQIIRVRGLARFWEVDTEIRFERYMEDLVTGLHGLGTPFFYLILGQPREIGVYLGTPGSAPGAIDLLRVALLSDFPDIRLQTLEPAETQSLAARVQQAQFWGRLTGIPTLKANQQGSPNQPPGRVEQIERLSRGLYGQDWGYLVVADPRPAAETAHAAATAFQSISNLYPQIKAQVQRYEHAAEERINRQAQYAVELLEAQLERLKVARAEGLWRVEVHLFAPQEATLRQGLALAQAIFAGEQSTPDPIRTFQCEPTPGDARLYVSFLHSGELSTLTQLPREEMPGYAVYDYARFDVALPERPVQKPVAIGEIVDRGAATGNRYAIERDDLARHALIVGATGSGKTNSCFCLLDRLWKGHQTPWLVIEPAKAEYRALQQVPGLNDLRIYTLGDETVAPFRLNPFEFEILDDEHRIHVQTHISHLRSVFGASFVLYAPMPYVLDMCLHEVYQDKGWDLATGRNRRAPRLLDDAGQPWPDLFPTLTELYHKIDEVVERLGYEERIEMDVKAGLKTRIDSLRLGGKGLMMDTRRGVPLGDLLRQPSVLELERIGDDDEKAFIIGLLLVRLYQHRLIQARVRPPKPLEHVTVVEEAHRLLKNVPTEVSTEEANVKGKAVEAFTNILSEIRAYGEGILIAEQIPTRLAPDAIKNTNLKLAHRLVAQDDRAAMAGAMNLDEDQAQYLTAIEVGRAVAYAEGADKPYLVSVLDYKGQHLQGRQLDDQAVAALMQPYCRAPLYDRYRGCAAICPARQAANQGRCDSAVRDMARRITAHPEFTRAFARYVLSAVEESSQLVQGFPALRKTVRRVGGFKDREERDVLTCVLVQAWHDHFEQRGRQYERPFNMTASLETQALDLSAQVVAGYLDDQSKLLPLADPAHQASSLFRAGYQQMCRRDDEGPFVGCKGCPAVCRYRYPVASLLRDERLRADFLAAARESGDEAMWAAVAAVARDAAQEAVTVSDPAIARAVALCYTVQQGAALALAGRDQIKLVRNVQRILATPPPAP